MPLTSRSIYIWHALNTPKSLKEHTQSCANNIAFWDSCILTGQMIRHFIWNLFFTFSDTFVCACKDGTRPSPGSLARFRSGIFPATGDSMVTVSFWYNVYRRDGGELQVFIMNHGSTNNKRILMRKESDGRGWRRADFNESVSEPFQVRSRSHFLLILIKGPMINIVASIKC